MVRQRLRQTENRPDTRDPALPRAPGAVIRRSPMSRSELAPAQQSTKAEVASSQPEISAEEHRRKPPQRVTASEAADPLLTVDDVARRLNVSRDWVWDHSSRKSPQLPVIRMG